MRKTILILLMLIISMGLAQQSFAVSEAAVLFLMIAPGARAAGMGEAFVAVADDATAVFWNPAGLAYQYGREVTIMHTPWLPGLASDMFYDFLAYKMDIEGVGTIGFGLVYINLGEQQGMDEFGNPTDRFLSNEFAMSASYGTTITENLAVGIGLRYIKSNLAPFGAGNEQGEGKGSSFAFDFGLLYKFPFLNKKLSWGMNISNMGPKIAYIDVSQADPLPTNLKTGFAYKLIDQKYNKLTLAADLNKLLVTPGKGEDNPADPFYKALFTSWYDDDMSTELKKLILGAGAEYWYNNLFALRVGYYYDEIGKVQFTSFGAGLKYSLYGFDFGYVSASEGHPLANTMRFSLTLGF